MITAYSLVYEVTRTKAQPALTSNMTGHHQGLKWKPWVGYTAPSWNRTSMCHQSYFCLLDINDLNKHHIFHRRVRYRAISMCYACIRYTWCSIILIP